MKKAARQQNNFGRLSTEQINPQTRKLSSQSIKQILTTINNEDRKVAEAVRKEIPAIARAASYVVKALRSGGRLVFVGAGTSGRLGIIEAAELFPTFGVGREMVQAIIAGGKEAMFRSVEGAEDNDRVVRELRKIGLNRKDIVLGISASGKTPFVVGAMNFARQVNAKTVALTTNFGSPICQHALVSICTRTGPEVLAGSTRMKAGTAHKLVLNMVSTVSMMKLGRVHGNLMVGLKPTSKKLRERAKRIVALETGLSYDKAAEKLKNAHMNVSVAILMAKANLDYLTARRLIDRAGGSLEKALSKVNS